MDMGYSSRSQHLVCILVSGRMVGNMATGFWILKVSVIIAITFSAIELCLWFLCVERFTFYMYGYYMLPMYISLPITTLH